MKTKLTTLCAISMIVLVSQLTAVASYSQGFEIDTWDWSGGVTRVISGTNGITSASGNYHAETSSNDYTFWGEGGYNSNWPSGGYYTSIDIYLDVALADTQDDVRFDWISAIAQNDGSHLRDWVFNAGIYQAESLVDHNEDGFIISASNNAGRGNSYPLNPGHDPILISDSGWYTFEHSFYDNGGFLAVDMSILDSSGILVKKWTLGGTDDMSIVGGSAYGWFANNEFSPLAIDNAQLVPEPATLALLGIGGLSLLRKRRRA